MLTISQAVKEGLLRDGVTPYSNVEPVDAAYQVMQGKFIFPYVGELPVLKNNSVDWQPEFDGNSASKNLWFYSFVFFDYLVKAFVLKNDLSFWDKAVEYYFSYRKWRGLNKDASAILFSDEHAVTNRSFVISQFLHVAINKSHLELYEILASDLKEHADWLMQDKHYVYNNHGVMMDRALLNAYSQLRDLKNIINISVHSSESWIEKALYRLNIMLDKTFDSNGCCTENSPSYHMLNLSLFGAIDRFLRNNDLPNETFNSKLKLAIDAANFMVHEDGSLPLIGDSEKKASVYVSESLNKGKYGIGYFPESGFSVIKEKGFYLSFKCGGSSFSHRHIDDTSITLRIKGLDFICDGGMYNYDNSDELRRYFVSHRAHSGFFPASASALLFKDFSKANDLARTTRFLSNEDGLLIEGESFYIKNSIFKRNIRVEKRPGLNYGSISIVDSFESQSLEKWVVQFLLHPEVQVTELSGGFILKRESISIFIGFCVNSAHEVKVESAFYSPSYLVSEKTSVIKITGESNQLRMLTWLTFD